MSNKENKLFAYHVVTEKPMFLGQHITFNSNTHNSVYNRVMEKSSIVEDIYKNSDKYNAAELEHHTSVAMRELALEEVRKEKYPNYPSRMNCLYVSKTLGEANKWFDWFVKCGRKTYQIIQLEIIGNCFIGDANNCFKATLNKQENLVLAERYWKNSPNANGDAPITEMLVDGDITVVDIIKDTGICNVAIKKQMFLNIARELNTKLNITPLMFGSLGLEQRLNTDLKAEDIDVLIPEEFINEMWTSIFDVMNDNGYTLYDLHEHAFEKEGISLAFASIENLTPFANVNITKLPIIEEESVRYYLLELQDYLKVYTASSKDGYRKNIKNKQDQQKIDLINFALDK